MIMDFLLALFIGHVGNTYQAHKQALKDHPRMAEIFFHDLKDDEPIDQHDDGFMCTSYDILR
jgi:hypothetical protein